jgi:hypothetical protein
MKSVHNKFGGPGLRSCRSSNVSPIGSGAGCAEWAGILARVFQRLQILMDTLHIWHLARCMTFFSKTHCLQKDDGLSQPLRSNTTLPCNLPSSIALKTSFNLSIFSILK